MYFDLYLAFDGRATYWHHVWESGVRLYAGSVRARFRAKVLLRCEVTSRLEAGKYFIPDAVFRMRAKQAHLAYDNLVFEHIPGIGGDAAKILGGAFHGAIRQWHPSLERGLLQKGNAAIVKAADTKDVRLSLGRVFSKVFPK